ncbi:hypothetical protein ACQ4PT_042740 [Festuca glaucescens]
MSCTGSACLEQEQDPTGVHHVPAERGVGHVSACKVPSAPKRSARRYSLPILATARAAEQNPSFDPNQPPPTATRATGTIFDGLLILHVAAFHHRGRARAAGTREDSVLLAACVRGMADEFFGDLEPSLQCLLAQGGGGLAEVEAVVGCSSQPSCVAAAATTLALDGSSSSHGSGNSVVGANCGAGDGADLQADATVGEAGEVSGCAVVSGWKRRHRVGKAPPREGTQLSPRHSLGADPSRFPCQAEWRGEAAGHELSLDPLPLPALIRLLRSKDNGWYICEHRDNHSHDLSASFGERAHWPSHKHIDSYTKDLVKQLRENNVNLSKVYSIIGSFFGKMENVPFTKRALKTLCGRISSEQADDDVRIPIEVFSEMGAADPEFTYSVQVDDDSGIMKLFRRCNHIRHHLQNQYQCRAMEVAIGNVLPATKHRWCKWHALRKAKERLGALYGKNSQFKVDFHRIVNQMLTKDEFGAAWMQMLSMYALEKNPYLYQIYETRDKWAKPFFSGIFCARMTNTQRSKSANHMLKTYVPPGSAMHVFVKQFNKLLYDRDAEESFQEKRTRLGGVVYKVGEPIEKHAAKIYTRTMFEKFQEVLYKSGSYYVNELVAGEVFVAKHFDSESREKWCKVEYRILVNDGYYSCECGMYEHMGMLCCHVVKVLVHLRCKEIPVAHVMKRWTVDARDVLPLHLVQYQKDQGLVTSFSFRHSQLYLNCMEVVRLGDVNENVYTTAMESIKVLVPKLKQVAVEGDGLGLEQRMNAKKPWVDAGPAQKSVELDGMQNAGGAAISLDAALLAPSKNRSGGRPTNSRDKPPYEATSKRTRFCTDNRLRAEIAFVR